MFTGASVTERRTISNVPGIARCIMGVFLSGAGNRVIQNSRSSFKTAPGRPARSSPFQPPSMVSEFATVSRLRSHISYRRCANARRRAKAREARSQVPTRV